LRQLPGPPAAAHIRKELLVTLGPIDQLRATKRLASTTTACPQWCDGDHELTGDDQGISHHRAVDNWADSLTLGVHLRAKEPVDAPGTLGPTQLVVYSDTDKLAGHGWLIEIPVDAKRLKSLRQVLDAALALIEHSDAPRLGRA
jgi:hypothetical protein